MSTRDTGVTAVNVASAAPMPVYNCAHLMRLARSFWWKALRHAASPRAAFVGALRGDDPRLEVLDAAAGSFERCLRSDPPRPAPGARIAFSATAYCKGLVTSSGVAAQRGVVAADPALLPVGSVIDLEHERSTSTTASTPSSTPARKFKAAEVDLYMWSCYEALRSAGKPAHVTVLRLGWNPAATTPSLIDRLFRRPENAAVAVRPCPSRRAPDSDRAQTRLEPEACRPAVHRPEL